MTAADVYRALLWCYPAQFRHEYGGEMVGAFSEQLRAARNTSGRLAQAGVWMTTLVDILPTALREHTHVIRQDLRYALRILTGNPGFTVVAVLSLALGIGANTAIFSLLNSVLFSTLPVRDPQELVILTDPASAGVGIGSENGDRSLLTYTEFRQLQEQTETFTSVMASQSSLSRTDARVDGGEPEDVAVRLVTASYFPTLGVAPLLGRTFDAAREPAETSTPFAVLSYDFWQRRFGGRPDVLGKTITFRGGIVSVIGVMPASFFGETIGERPDAWVPLAMQSAVMPGRSWLRDAPGSVEKVMWLHAFGRLKPGVSLERAQANANVVFQQGLTSYYGSLPDETMRKRFLKQRLLLRQAATGASSLRDDFAQPLQVLLGAAALVLLIACSNLGNLMLARTTARNREMAVRLALGASRGRLTRQLLTESLCLALLGGAIGLATAFVLRAGLLRLVSDNAIAMPAALDLRVLGFVLGLTLVSGLFLGLLPAMRVTNAEALTGLREQGRGIAGSVAWLRIGKAVVIGQLALSLPLLVGSGLLVRTLVNLQRVDLGYPKDDLLTLRVDAQAAQYEPVRQALAFESLLERIRAIPGVRSATFSNNGLFQGSDNGDEIEVEGYTRNGDGRRKDDIWATQDQGSAYDQVGPGYFSTLGVPILLGREITGEDRPGGRTVCVINETFAKKFFAGRHPIGLHVTQKYAEERHTYEIVGVVRDSRQNRLRREIEHRIYMPATQPSASINGVTFIIRPHGDGSTVLAAARRIVQQAEPKMTMSRVGTVTEAIDSRIVQERLLARLSIGFGIVAILLAAMGLYGVLSYGVARRTSEIGIRKALGAQPAALIGMILRETGWLLAIGLVVGGAISAGAMQLITSQLYGLSASDPLTFAIAITGLTSVALVATWLPAYRASRVDPLVALRYE